MFRGKLLHKGMNHEKSGRRGGDYQQDQPEDKERSLLAHLRRWLGNSEGTDERVGEKVKEAHRVLSLGGLQVHRGAQACIYCVACRGVEAGLHLYELVLEGVSYVDSNCCSRGG